MYGILTSNVEDGKTTRVQGIFIKDDDIVQTTHITK